MSSWSDPESLHRLCGYVIAPCAVVVLAAVAMNFARSGGSGAVREERHSPVATGTMLLFTFGFYELVHMRLGEVAAGGVALSAVGLVLVVMGTALGVAGRLKIGSNWANQATLYESQRLVTSGAYALVRHPLYAGLIWMFVGAALAYHNVAALGAALVVFVPMMTYRAALEERMLSGAFPEYVGYAARVGRFAPRLRRR